MARVKFGDVVKEVKDNVARDNNPYEYFIAGEHMESENIHLTTRGMFKYSDVGPAFIRIFCPGQILYGSRRTYLKKVAVADFEGITSNTTFVLESKNPDVFLQKLLPFIMLTERFTDFAIKNSKGSTNPYILFSDLARYEFELPPMEEQIKLAEVLWAFDKTREAYKALLTSTEELVQAQFIEMFGDPTTNFTKWGQLPLKDACDRLNDGPFGSNLKSEHYTQEGVRVIRLQNIGVGMFLNEDKAFVSSKHYEKIKKYTCRAGDIVIGTLGEPNLRACIVPDGIPLAINKADCVHCVPKSDLLVNKFVCQYLNSPSTLRLASSMIHGQTRGRISSGQIAKLPIPIPPISLQVQFATFAESTVNSNYALQRSLSTLDQARNALMEKTFR